ncbi:MAG: aspartate/glutamate racemase family protein [Oscillospiraceae bacterium]|nr:aspartate/glutamate racemase family protein [Oscillospiraceae bacterium]MBR7074921.1 aspartate/glutamate racemase family protein [Oscillospiraceae bacterium]
MHITDKPVAVLAGTPVDTQMGADVLRAHGLEPRSFPVSRHPLEQAAFQVKSKEEKHAALTEILRQAMNSGCGSAFIYCNSLSGSADFPVLSRALGIRIVTPMDAYGTIARQYRRLGVVAYNGQALAGIDTVMVRANPDILLQPAGIPEVTIDIEAGLPPKEIICRRHLAELMAYFAACGCEALVLGCTHFPYLTDTLRAYTSLPLLDPAEEMVRQLTEEGRHA